MTGLPKLLPKIKDRVFYGWWVVLACATNSLYLGGVYFYGFSALFDPVVEEFGWSRALVSFAFTFRGFEAGIAAPFIGIFADRFGARKLFFWGIVVSGFGFVLLSHIQALWSFYAVSLVLAVGSSLTSPVVTMTAVAKWFRRGMVLAMGLLMAGNAAGGLLLPGTVWAIDRFGWREALIIFGVGIWLLGIPLSLVVKEPQSGGDFAHKARVPLEATEKLPEMTPKEVLRERDFWLLSVAVLFGGSAGMAVIVHQIPYLVSEGIPRQTAGFMVTAFALANITGRLVFGWLGDITDKKHCFAVAAALKAIGVLALALAGNVEQFIGSLVALGIGFGGLVPLRPAMQVELFGSRAFGTVQGFLMAAVTVGTMIAPPFAGWVFDSMGSYRPAFLILGACTLIAVPVILAISRKPRKNFGAQ